MPIVELKATAAIMPFAFSFGDLQGTFVGVNGQPLDHTKTITFAVDVPSAPPTAVAMEPVFELETATGRIEMTEIIWTLADGTTARESTHAER
jgi:hypothetical protein